MTRNLQESESIIIRRWELQSLEASGVWGIRLTYLEATLICERHLEHNCSQPVGSLTRGDIQA